MQLTPYDDVRVPNFSVRIMRDVLAEAGLDPLPVFAAARSDPRIALHPGAVVTGAQELAFQRKFVELTTNQADLWVQVGLGYSPFASLGSFGLALSSSPTLTHWIQVVSEIPAPYSLVQRSPILDANGTLTGLLMSPLGVPPELIPFSLHRDLAATLQTLQMMTSKTPFPLTTAELPLKTVAPTLEDLIPVPITATDSSSLRIKWDPQLSTQQLPLGNALQHEAHLLQARKEQQQFQLEEDWTRRTIRAIREVIDTAPTIDKISRALNTSPRTLQRRLTQDGLTFRQALDLARFELATELLINTNMPISHISRQLGYEEHASFTTAFRRWTGRTPSEYRTAPYPLEP